MNKTKNSQCLEVDLIIHTVVLVLLEEADIQDLVLRNKEKIADIMKKMEDDMSDLTAEVLQTHAVEEVMNAMKVKFMLQDFQDEQMKVIFAVYLIVMVLFLELTLKKIEVLHLSIIPQEEMQKMQLMR